MKNLNVVMYHYVRNSTYSKFRNLKFLSLNNFKNNLIIWNKTLILLILIHYLVPIINFH